MRASVVAVCALAGVLLPLAASGWKLQMAPNYVHEGLVGKAVALLQDPSDLALGKQILKDLTDGDVWTDMPLGKDGELVNTPADIQGFLNLLVLSPFSEDFLLKQSQSGCLMHWHCMAPKLQGSPNTFLTVAATRSLILGQMSYWWDRAVATKDSNDTRVLSNGYVGHMLHTTQDCHPRGHTIRDMDQLWGKDGDTFGMEDETEKSIMAKLDVKNLKCGRILYFQGDVAQNTAGVPPLDNDLGTHGGWDKLPYGVQSYVPENLNEREIPSAVSGSNFKPEYSADESTRQLQLEACSVYASYRVLRPWLRCLKDSSTCSAGKEEALKVLGQYVLQTAPDSLPLPAGGAWERVFTPDDQKRGLYTLTTIGNSSRGTNGFTPVGVYLPLSAARWNISRSEADAFLSSQPSTLTEGSKYEELPLCNYVKGTTRDDFGAASKDAGPYTDFYNPKASALTLRASGGQPCSSDEECISGDCGGSVYGQDYCSCGSAETNCTLSSSAPQRASQSAWMMPAAFALLCALLSVLVL